MRLLTLKQDLAAIAPHLSDWSETNVEGVRLEPWGVCFLSDESELESKVSALEDDLRSAEKELAEYDAKAAGEAQRADKAEAEIDRLKAALADIIDPATGCSLASYLERAETAERRAQEWQGSAKAANQRTVAAQDELTALRKRKGVEPGLMLCARDVVNLLRSLGSDAPQVYSLNHYQEDAKRILKRMDQ